MEITSHGFETMNIIPTVPLGHHLMLHLKICNKNMQLVNFKWNWLTLIRDILLE